MDRETKIKLITKDTTNLNQEVFYDSLIITFLKNDMFYYQCSGVDLLNQPITIFFRNQIEQKA